MMQTLSLRRNMFEVTGRQRTVLFYGIVVFFLCVSWWMFRQTKTLYSDDDEIFSHGFAHIQELPKEMLPLARVFRTNNTIKNQDTAAQQIHSFMLEPKELFVSYHGVLTLVFKGDLLLCT